MTGKMAEITQVEPQEKNSHRFNIFIDGKFTFGADEDLVVNYRLIPGKVINENDLNQLISEAEIGKLMEKMYNLFSFRQRSEKEVKEYFKRKNQEAKIKNKELTSDLVVDQLVEKLKQKGMINDLEFARSWIEVRRRSKQKSNRALKMELIQKGMNREIIEEVLSEPFDSAQGEEQLARQVLEKKTKSWKKLPDMEFKKRAYGYLARKGFSYSDIKTTVEKFLQKE